MSASVSSPPRGWLGANTACHIWSRFASITNTPMPEWWSVEVLGEVVFKTAGFFGFQAIANISVAGSAHKHDAFASQRAWKVQTTTLYASLQIDPEILLIQLPIFVACRFSSYKRANPNAALIYLRQKNLHSASRFLGAHATHWKWWTLYKSMKYAPPWFNLLDFRLIM